MKSSSKSGSTGRFKLMVERNPGQWEILEGECSQVAMTAERIDGVYDSITPAMSESRLFTTITISNVQFQQKIDADRIRQVERAIRAEYSKPRPCVDPSCDVDDCDDPNCRPQQQDDSAEDSPDTPSKEEIKDILEAFTFPPGTWSYEMAKSLKDLEKAMGHLAKAANLDVSKLNELAKVAREIQDLKLRGHFHHD